MYFEMLSRIKARLEEIRARSTQPVMVMPDRLELIEMMDELMKGTEEHLQLISNGVHATKMIVDQLAAERGLTPLEDEDEDLQVPPLQGWARALPPGY